MLTEMLNNKMAMKTFIIQDGNVILTSRHASDRLHIEQSGLRVTFQQ